jgi:predicted glycosyltransferase
MSRVLFHVQHLLGTGHLRRAAAIAAALSRHAFAVELVSGGMPIAGLALGGARLVQLPPARAGDASFKTLVDDGGRAVDESWKAARRDALLARLASFRPDVVLTELFPLGRNALSFELAPLIETARAAAPRPLILASVRDILAIKTDPRKLDAMVERVRAWYDHVLVHGDPALIALGASFPEHRIADKVVYTGYVADPASPTPSDGDGEIVVSAGGGAVGARLMQTAVAAKRLAREGRRTWRLLIGADVAPAARAALMAARGPGLVIEAARPDFPDLLARAHVSVSQAGYNTVMDVITARARAVLVPFAGGHETEQSMRAAAMAAHGWAQVVAETELTPERLAAAVDQAALAPRPDPAAIRRDGAAATARLIQRWLAERSARA